MKRPKWTTRSMMCIVLGLAFVLGLSIPAVLASRDDERHCHSFLQIDENGFPFLHADSTPSPFLSRYWRYLTGSPRRPRQDCGAWTFRIEEVCEWGHPEIGEPLANGTNRLIITPAQLAEFARRGQARANGR